jgi:hypothetical protein
MTATPWQDTRKLYSQNELDRLRAYAVKTEREACAKLAEEHYCDLDECCGYQVARIIRARHSEGAATAGCEKHAHAVKNDGTLSASAAVKVRAEGIVVGLEMADKFLSLTQDRNDVASMIQAAILAAKDGGSDR